MTTRRLITALPAILAAALPLCAAELGPVEVHGTLSQGYLDSRHNNFIEESNKGTFAFREYGLNVTVLPLDNVILGGQLFGRDFGSVGEDTVYMDWLNVDYTWRDWLGFRAGKLKTPYGFYGETRDIDSLRTEVLLPQGVYMEYIRGLYDSAWGGALHGYVPWEGLGGFSYLFQGGARDDDAQDDDMQRLLLGRGLFIEHTDPRPTFAAALTWHTPIEGLRAGATGCRSEHHIGGYADSPFGASPFTADIHDSSMAVGSAEYARGPVTLAAEVMHGSFETLFDYASPFAPDMTFSARYWGGYLKANYRFANRLSVAGGYSYFDYDQTIALAGVPTTLPYAEGQRDGFVSLRFDLTENLIIKVEQHFLSGVAGLFAHENPDGIHEHWAMTLAKLSFVF